MRSLPNIRSGVVHDHSFYFGTAVELDGRPTFIHETKREADILEGAGKTEAALEVRLMRWYELEILRLVLA